MARSTGTPPHRRLDVALAAAALLVTGCTSVTGTSTDEPGTDRATTPARTGETLGPEQRFATQSARGIHNDALVAMRDVETLRMRGQVTGDGEAITVDVRATPTGSCTGVLGLSDGETEFTQVRERAWIRPSPAFWRATAPEQADRIVEAVGERWVTIPRGDGSFDRVCDVEALLDGLGEAEEATVGELETLDSRPAVSLVHTDDDATSTIWVAADEPHHILRIESDGGDEPGRLVFSDFDTGPRIKPPPEGQVTALD